MQTQTTINPAKNGKLAGSKHVDTLVSTYKKERWVQNSEKLGKPDSLSTWYGLDELSDFLALAREHQADGVKMYFGVYPDDYPHEPMFAGRQTVVLVATRKKETLQGIVNKNIYVNRSGVSEILAFNYGPVCPPYCSEPTNPMNPLGPSEGGWYGVEMEKAGLTIIDHNGEIKIA